MMPRETASGSPGRPDPPMNSSLTEAVDRSWPCRTWPDDSVLAGDDLRRKVLGTSLMRSSSQS
jgi:hypothetical protein